MARFRAEQLSVHVEKGSSMKYQLLTPAEALSALHSPSGHPENRRVGHLRVIHPAGKHMRMTSGAKSPQAPIFFRLLLSAELTVAGSTAAVEAAFRALSRCSLAPFAAAWSRALWLQHRRS